MNKNKIDNIRKLTESALKYCDNEILWRSALAEYVKNDLSKVLKICKELLQQADCQHEWTKVATINGVQVPVCGLCGYSDNG